MADDRMDPEALARWRDALGLKLVCTACGGTDFGVHRLIGAPILQGGQVPAQYQVAPLQPISCSHCGLVMLFLATPGQAR